MAKINGAALIAKCLKQQGVKELFGVVGIPVTGIAKAAQDEGIRYIGTRHEQAAGFAAQAVSYIRGHVGVALTVSGPGMTNATTALGNAWSNCWPMVLLGGATDLEYTHRGGFQEAPQMAIARPFCKWVGQPTRAEDVPRMIEHAFRTAWHGRPGPVYIDLPGDIIEATLDDAGLAMPAQVAPPPRMAAPPELVAKAVETLRAAKKPLLIVGKGSAWSEASTEVRRFVERTDIPVLPTPMGKGVVPDDHPNVVSAARSYVLKNADVILLAGARLNWILHFGAAPRFNPDVKVIQIDLAQEEIGTNVPATVGLTGDLKAVMTQLVGQLEESPWECDPKGEWKKGLTAEVAKRKAELKPALESNETPMGYFRPLNEIQKVMPRDAILVAEGASTMDISRSVLENYFPKKRLDAGSWGTMGAATGFALASAVVHPEHRVIALMGDASFGFSGMEIEVAARYKLPITWIVFTNGGIGGGVAKPQQNGQLPVNVYQNGCRYDKVMEAFGGKGFHCESPDQLAKALQAAFASGETALINVAIAPTAKKAPQTYTHWLTR
ncbi:MAG: oxalyl-CoA decarboxylase [Candidatus Lambdaproteobacteria bacterium]|nr:oxalyl-CoA decarboxylase [Candidatus Lambdaproteobacteria bacterium]